MSEPVGVVLAGGQGRRMGGDKASVLLGGRPLIEYPLAALRSVLDEVAVVTKADVRLPPLPGVTVWIEPDEPRHPLVGLVEALALADGRPVLSCPVDLPLVAPSLLRVLTTTDPEGAPAVVASFRGRLQPLLGCFQPDAISLLAAHAREGVAPVRQVVAGIAPRLIEVADEHELLNVNSPEDLLLAAAKMGVRAGGRRDQPNVKS